MSIHDQMLKLKYNTVKRFSKTRGFVSTISTAFHLSLKTQMGIQALTHGENERNVRLQKILQKITREIEGYMCDNAQFYHKSTTDPHTIIHTKRQRD